MHKRPKATFYKRASKAARVDLCGILLGDVGDVVVEGNQNIYMAQEAERKVPEAEAGAAQPCHGAPRCFNTKGSQQ